MKYVFILFWFSASCLAQEMVIQPEETPYLLQPGQIQIETAIGYREETKENRTFILPNSLWKIGILNTVEFRVNFEQQWLQGEENVIVIQPVLLGFKTKLWEEKKGLPEAAFIAQTTIPKWASASVSRLQYAPELQLLLQGNYSDTFSMNYNVGTKWDGISSRPFYTYKTTGSYMLHPSWFFYAEIFGHQHSLEPSHISYNNGIMYQINKDMMLDFSGGFGLNHYAPNLFCAMIFSFQL